MRCLERLCCVAVSTVPLLAAGVQAQVDWGPLLGEKGAPAAVETPQRRDVPTAAVRSQGRVTPSAHEAGAAPPKPMRRRRVETSRSRRQTPKEEPSEEREYPAVPAGHR